MLKVSLSSKPGKKPNGANIWVGTRIFKAWSCLRRGLNFAEQLRYWCTVAHVRGVFGATHRCTQSAVSQRGIGVGSLKFRDSGSSLTAECQLRISPIRFGIGKGTQPSFASTAWKLDAVSVHLVLNGSAVQPAMC